MIAAQAAVNLQHQHPSCKVIIYASIISSIRNKVISIEICHKINVRK